jgi:excisionase family DNA binding protein
MTAVHSPTAPAAQLLDVEAVGAMLGCSPRTVYRLSDAGRMPAPVRLGALVRWSKAAVEEWIGAGCPRCDRRAAR